MARHAQWLQSQLPALVEAGVLDAAAAQRLRAHYGPQAEGPGWGLILLATGGALLIGLGVILIFAHNWENWTPELRVLLSLLPLLAGQAACAWALRRGGRAAAEAAASFTALAAGAAIALVAQTYQFGGDLPQFLLTWTLLALPLAYLLDASAVAVLCWLGALGWTLATAGQGAEHVAPAWRLPLFLLLFTLPLPHLLRHARADRGSARVAWMLRVALPVLALGYAAALGFARPGELLLAYGGMAAAAALAGERYFAASGGAWGNPLRSAGLCGALVLALIALVEPLWDHVRLPPLPALPLPLGFAAAALWLAARAARIGEALLPAALAALPLLLWLMAGLAGQSLAAAAVLAHLYALGLAAALVLTGLRQSRLGLANAGLSLLAALLLLRFFDSELSYVLRGFAFIGIGLLFFAANFWLRRRLRSRR